MKAIFITMLICGIGAAITSEVGDPGGEMVVDTIRVTAEDPNKPPRPVEDILDIYDVRAVDVISGADRVRASISSTELRQSHEEDPLSSRSLCDWVVAEEGRILSSGEADLLASVVLDHTLYEYAQYACVFDPKYAFTFYSAKDTLTVLLSSRCMFVSLCHEDQSYGHGTFKSSIGQEMIRFSRAIWGAPVDRGQFEFSSPN
jgi:hypothetical protein